MAAPVAGHGTLVYTTLDPVGSPSTYTLVAKVIGDVMSPGLQRPSDEVTGHEDDIDSYVTGRLARDEISFELAYMYDHTSHSGIQALLLTPADCGLKIVGPEGSAGVDEIIVSGRWTAFKWTSPAKQGVRGATATFRPSGPMIIDGETYGG